VREKKTFHFRSDFVRKLAESAFRYGIENRFARESSFKQPKFKRLKTKYYEPLTHAYALWAANVLFAVFAPAFPLSPLRQEIRPQTAQAHSLGR
jgi:hypothetical protein